MKKLEIFHFNTIFSNYLKMYVGIAILLFILTRLWLNKRGLIQTIIHTYCCLRSLSCGILKNMCLRTGKSL